VKGKFTAEAQRTPRLRREGEREKRKKEEALSFSLFSSNLCEISAFSAPLR
jgi:hypothetical protein